MAMKKCPVCGVPVKVENLERHVRNQHPHERVDLAATLSEEDREALAERKSAGRPGLTHSGRRLVLVAAIVVAVLVAVAILYPYLGTRVTDFTLQSTEGTTVSLSAWRGSPVLVEFMDLDCPYCQQVAPALLSAYQNYSGRGVKFVSIDMNFEGAADTPQRIYTERTTPGYAFYGASWPFCLDPGQTVQSNYGVTSTPTVFVLRKDGTIFHEYVGAQEVSLASLQSALNAVLGG